MKRDLKIYLPIMGILFLIGLSTRVAPFPLPFWFERYAGDFLWAMLVFFLIALVFRRSTRVTFGLAIVTTWFIEWTQLFDPPWLQTLRSFRLIGFVIGYSFLWTDLVSYALGIALAALIDWVVLSRGARGR